MADDAQRTSKVAPVSQHSGLRVTSGSTTWADLNLDGNVGPADLAIVLSGWGTASPLADLDDDGDVDAADLLRLLNAWGPCN